VEFNLTAQRQQVDLGGAAPTDMFLYNGQLPGPTIEATEGDWLVVHFTNNLPEPTNIHWHGLVFPPDQDGVPMDVVPPAGKRDYAFRVLPGSAGTYWYHPHPMGLTTMQVAKGLAGAIRIKAKADPLPAALGDTLVLLSDLRLDAQGQIPPSTTMDKMNGREGDIQLINGQRPPVLPLSLGESRRLRIIDASAARYYRLQARDARMVQVGTDGGLLAAPVERSELLLVPGARAEVILTPTGPNAALFNLPYDRGVMAMSTPGSGTMGHGSHMMPDGTMMTMAASGAAIPLLQLVPTGPPVTAVTLPAILRPIAPLPLAGAFERPIVLTEDMMNLDFRINGQTFKADRIDFQVTRGQTEIWRLENKGDMDHPFHVHGVQFQVLDRDGVAVTPLAWQDTVNVRKGDVVRIAIRFEHYTGLRPFHCHILEHEEQGMMGQVEVKE
jgi:bilirubin oxidase